MSTSMSREQMSISSITMVNMDDRPYCLYENTQNSTFNKNHLIRSPPTSPEQDQLSLKTPPSSPYSSYDGSNNDNTIVLLQERRQRNKAASAKYRQKKNVQQHEMRSMINKISERNAILERQLMEMREENQKLRAAADKLRGKCVAKKLLRQWMERQGSTSATHSNKDIAPIEYYNNTASREAKIYHQQHASLRLLPREDYIDELDDYEDEDEDDDLYSM